jgi:hypothetical protein|tara:strand:- start:692 stop:916 length:225 start_codon:yes stop_codon:yes gene_type:complete
MTVNQILQVIASLEANSISGRTGRCVECGDAANMGTPQQMAHGNGCDTDVAIEILGHELYIMRERIAKHHGGEK